MEIEKVYVANISEDDTIVFKCPYRVSETVLKNIRAMLRQEFPTQKILILDDGCDLLVIKKEDEDKLNVEGQL